MQKIKKLPIHEAQKIAAGEVIERPANLLKELIENAIDADSTKISIYVQDGGRQLIRVVDDGCGMSPEDAALCFEQHATSKIQSVDELHTIATFGFRGEALASIAAVARVSLITKEQATSDGTKIAITQNAITENDRISATQGTDIAVHDLFYNLPARKKFLKKRETEWRQIQHLFFAQSLAHLSLEFKLYSEKKLLYHCPKAPALTERWQQLFGNQSSTSMISLSHHTEHITIKGIISDHQVQRYDRSNIYIFVNNRWIKDSTLTRACIKGYQNVLPPGRYPSACLFITIDPQEIDVNIHPRKEEVQFLHPRRAEKTIQTAITTTLEQRLSEQLKKSVSLAPQQPSLHTPFEPFAAFERPPSHQTDPSIVVPFEDLINQRPQAPSSPMTQNAHPDRSPSFFEIHHEKSTQPARSLEEDETNEQIATSEYHLIGQYKKTYLLLEHRDGLFLLDQHAAQERILYERFIKTHGDVASIPLLFAQTMSCTQELVAIVDAHKELFAQYGIILEPFGTQTITIRATPIHLQHVPLEPIIHTAAALMQEYAHLDTDDLHALLQKKLYADIACKAAVKAGDTLTQEQMQQLLVDLEKTENRFLCPHGRPTSWLLHNDEIKKKFKRDYRSQKKDDL